MFGDLLTDQRQDVQALLSQQAIRFEKLIATVHMANEETQHRIRTLESILQDKLSHLEIEMKIQKNKP
jgi:hypothetical protein